MLGGGDKSKPDSPTLTDCRWLVEIDGAYELIQRSTMNKKRLGHSACAVGDFGIVVSGTKIDDASSCEYFDINKNTWTEIARLNQPRHYHSSCSFNGRQIYVFGGAIESGTYLSSIEMLDIGKILDEEFA